MDRTAYQKWLDEQFPDDPNLRSECMRVVDESDAQDISPVMVLRIIHQRRNPTTFEQEEAFVNQPFTSW